MTCNKQKITTHDRFGIFRSSLEIVMSGILKDDNYLYYKYGLFMGMEDKRLSHHYPCHTDMITYSLPAHEHSIPHFLKKLKKAIKTCEHWGLYKYLTCAMCKRGDDRMDPFAMDFDDKEENKEMTDDNDFTDMTPQYMFQKFELVLFLLADKMAYLGSMSPLRLQDKLNISDGSVFRIQQELGPVGGNDKRLVLYKMFVGLLQDVGMLKMCEMLRSANSSACDYDMHYKVVQNMHRYINLSDKQDADWIVSLMLGQRDALPSDLYRKCQFFEEEGGDLSRSELHSDGEEEEGEKPRKSNGNSQGVVQGCTPVTSAC